MVQSRVPPMDDKRPPTRLDYDGSRRTELQLLDSRFALRRKVSPVVLYADGGRSVGNKFATLQKGAKPPLNHDDTLDDLGVETQVEATLFRLAHVDFRNACQRDMMLLIIKIYQRFICNIPN